MIHGVIVRYNCSLYFLFKKHYCHECQSTYVRKKREKIVHSESKEAKNYDFQVVDTGLYGNIKFVTYYFECPKCETIYEIEELKEIEKENRRKKRRKFFG